jgi:hypothetical protein
MSQLFEGDFIGKAIKAEFGVNGKSGKPELRASIEIVSPGERLGAVVGYSGSFKAESVKFTKRDMKALGWKGVDVSTFVDDVMAAAAEGKTFPFQARIAEWTNPDGKLRRWVAAGSIGYEAVPLNRASNDVAARVNEWLNEDNDSASGSGSYNEDIPFAPISRKI